MPGEIKITFVDIKDKKKDVWTVKGKKLWEILTEAGLDVSGSCGGSGTCGKCKVQITGSTSIPGEEEKRLLLTDEIKAGVRLACYYTITEPLEVKLNYTALEQSTKTLINDFADDEAMTGRPVTVKKIFVSGYDENAPKSIHDRIQETLTGLELEISPQNIKELVNWDRTGRPVLELNALIFNGHTVKRIHRENPRAFGIAFDLGSTTLLAALVDLEEGTAVAVVSHTNMQRVYGEDLISRVNYCVTNPEGLEKLHQIMINNLNAMIDELLLKACIASPDVYSVTVAGNPIMTHILLNLTVKGFGSVPFVGVFSSHITVSAASTGLQLEAQTPVYILPSIGGFVGADITAGLLMLNDIGREKFIMIDIGTNGEIVAGNNGELWATSAAAGPAFEGGGLNCGMRALEGALNHVKLGGDGNLIFHWLGNQGIKGICGSGALDLLAALYEGDYIDDNGIFTAMAFERLNMEKHPENRLLISDGENKSSVSFSQEDIRQLQLAKSAVRTGVDILLEQAGLSPGELEALYLAGSFGSYLNPAAAKVIGLIPNIDGKKIVNLGNAAGLGGIQALLHESRRKKAEHIAKSVRHVELALQPEFNNLFIKNINFAKQ
ncbi:MAG: ASKHA domain-containing protein [Syntrophomonadaceae bacterium]|nr:ASKHA domain-containing protein [Syntrophomonadaceae bacterium]